MKQMFKLVQIPVVTLVLLFSFYSSSFAVVAGPVTVYENWDGNYLTVDFSIQTDLSNIIGFAVGNDRLFNYGVRVDFDASNPAPDDWVGVAAAKVEGTNWMAVTFDPKPSAVSLPDWMNLDAVLSEYNRAFVFYSSNNTFSFLSADFSNGFNGYAFNAQSTFAVFTSDSDGNVNILTGETSTVPIPGAAILFLSGIVGLVGMKRKS